MNDPSRDAILARLGAGPAATGAPGVRRAAPAALPPGSPALVEAWLETVQAAGASVARAASPSAVGTQVASYLAQAGLPPAVVAAPDLRPLGVAWPEGLTVTYGPTAGEDRVAVTGAFAGVAETGSIVCLGGPGHPTGLNFLCEHHVAVVRESAILADLDGLWQALADAGHALPRAVNIITGPSRTADIEQRLQLGAHGPRRLHLVLLATA